MPPPPLDVVPESVVFRGVDVGQAGVKRTLLLKNTSSRLLEGLLTHPLSGAFELKLPEASADGAPGRAVEEPGFFHSFTLSPNETLKVSLPPFLSPSSCGCPSTATDSPSFVQGR